MDMLNLVKDKGINSVERMNNRRSYRRAFMRRVEGLESLQSSFMTVAARRAAWEANMRRFLGDLQKVLRKPNPWRFEGFGEPNPVRRITLGYTGTRVQRSKKAIFRTEAREVALQAKRWEVMRKRPLKGQTIRRVAMNSRLSWLQRSYRRVALARRQKMLRKERAWAAMAGSQGSSANSNSLDSSRLGTEQRQGLADAVYDYISRTTK